MRDIEYFSYDKMNDKHYSDFGTCLPSHACNLYMSLWDNVRYINRCFKINTKFYYSKSFIFAVTVSKLWLGFPRSLSYLFKTNKDRPIYAL